MSSTDDYLGQQSRSMLALTSEQWPEKVLRDKEVIIGDDIFIYNVWIDEIDKSKLLVFELRIKKLFFEQTFMRAIVETNCGNKILDEEQLWEMGIS
jgi:hypothetical protein